jgi:hypothetical protein
METQKLQSAADDNYMKLKMDQTRYQVALDKGDMQAATALATQIRTGNMQAKDLDERIRHNKAIEGLTGAHYAQAAGTSVQKIADDLMSRGFKGTREEALERAGTIIGGVGSKLENAQNLKLSAALQGDMNLKLLGLRLQAAKTPEEQQQIMAKIEQQKQNVIRDFRLTEGGGGASVGIPQGVTVSKIGQ